MSALQLIAGLGNPGQSYARTRHNAGAWFVQQLVDNENLHLDDQKKFQCRMTTYQSGVASCYLVVPTTYINQSGWGIKKLIQFYRLDPRAVLIVHDDLDLPVGTARLKQGGGHGGHNGLRDISQQLGRSDFLRLRIGIGHPGHKALVHDYVLGKPSPLDKKHIDDSIIQALSVLPWVINGEWQKAVHALHSKPEE